MLADRERMEAYEAAITQSVRPGMRVLDLGTGTGVLAMWAAKAGAEVVAVEPHAVIEVAKRVAADNGLADRIRFVRADSRELTLEQPVDLVVTECMGNFFVTDEMQPVLRDLPRHLAPGGKTLPLGISLHVAGATLPMWNELAFWQEPVGGFDYTGALDFARQSAYVVGTEPELLVTAPSEVARFDLVESPDTFSLRAELEVLHTRTLHAVIGWFDAQLTADVTLSTRPGTRTHWGQTAFSVPSTPVVPGDVIEVEIELVMDADLKSRWAWRGVIRRPGREDVAFEADTAMRFGGVA
ncbi:MAG: methyltransferase domain-containing protein [Deltaproteobacteria bacterium]|nr:MAG: methyltransferase domain-containing protein [Deltaproteobacteria bacterium]